VLIAFFATHPYNAGRGKLKFDSIVVAIAFAALVAIAGSITGAWPFQDHVYPDSQYCRAIGVNAATSAVHDLAAVGPDGATLGQLKILGQNQLKQPKPIKGDTALDNAFTDAYESSFGDCQAGIAEIHLYWIALPLFGVTLIWWFVTFWIVRRNKIHDEKQRSARSAAARPAGAAQTGPVGQPGC
jgi:hypothetical protein